MIHPRPVLALVALATTLATASAAEAIIRRHDVPDARYRAFGQTHRHTVAGFYRLSPTGAQPSAFGTGTLVAPTWILTAAHVADGVKPDEHWVVVAGERYKIADVHLHPDPETPGNDVGLVRLSMPVIGGRPACLYSRRDEAGKVSELAGYGLPGDGVTGVGKREPGSVLRGSTVRIDRADEQGVLAWDFRGPGKGATPLEGISAPGDSGGPAFLRESGRLCVAGVSGGQDRKGGPEGLYGVTEFYTRVSSRIDWLRKTMAADQG